MWLCVTERGTQKTRRIVARRGRVAVRGAEALSRCLCGCLGGRCGLCVLPRCRPVVALSSRAPACVLCVAEALDIRPRTGAASRPSEVQTSEPLDDDVWWAGQSAGEPPLGRSGVIRSTLSRLGSYEYGDQSDAYG